MTRFAPFLLLLAACASAPEIPEELKNTNVVFEGAERVSPSDLLQLIEADLQRYAAFESETVLDDAAYRISHYYRLRGFAFVEVVPAREKAKILFRIEEGPLVVPGRVHFRNNKALGKDDLKGILPQSLPGSSTPFSQRLLGLQTQAIIQEYQRKGFMDVKVTVTRQNFDPKESRMNVTFEIDEGPRFNLRDIEGLPDVESVRKDVSGLLGKPFNPGIPAALETAIVEHYRESGRPFAQAMIRTVIERDTSTILLQCTSIPGNAARIGKLKIKGNDQTRKGFIESRVGLEPGDPYAASALRDAENRLRRTGLFKTATVLPGKLQEDELDIEVELQEAEPGHVAITAGYGTLDGLRLGADAGYRNLFGGGELVKVGGTYSRFRARGTVELAVPNMFGSELQGGISGYYEDAEFPSFDVVSFGAVPSLNLRITETVTSDLGVRLAVIDTTDVETGVPPGDLLDFEYQALFLAMRWDERDSALLPRSGILLNGIVEYSGSVLNSDIRFFKANGKITGYLPLWWDMVLAASLQGGIIQPQDGTEVIPISLRYFAGGTNTVRGFESFTLGPKVNGEPTGGEAYVAVQLELRFPILGDLHGAFFHDRGQVWFDTDDVNLDDLRWSAGLGLRYYTPAGPIVADVAWNPSHEGDEDEVEFHVSIGFPF